MCGNWIVPYALCIFCLPLCELPSDEIMIFSWLVASSSSSSATFVVITSLRFLVCFAFAANIWFSQTSAFCRDFIRRSARENSFSMSQGSCRFEFTVDAQKSKCTSEIYRETMSMLVFDSVISFEVQHAIALSLCEQMRMHSPNAQPTFRLPQRTEWVPRNQSTSLEWLSCVGAWE